MCISFKNENVLFFLMRENWSVIRATLQEPKYGFLALGLSGAFFAAIFFLTDYALFAGNAGVIHTTIYTALNAVVALLFGVYVALFFSRRSEAKAVTTMTGVIGAGASFMVTGCASCSFTLAAFLGFGSMVSFLPYKGLELSALGILLLVFSIKKLSDPMTCKMKPARKKSRRKKK
jgi:hypothetical protein